MERREVFHPKRYHFEITTNLSGRASVFDEISSFLLHYFNFGARPGECLEGLVGHLNVNDDRRNFTVFDVVEDQ